MVVNHVSVRPGMILQVVETYKEHYSKGMIRYDFEQKIGTLRFCFFFLSFSPPIMRARGK